MRAWRLWKTRCVQWISMKAESPMLAFSEGAFTEVKTLRLGCTAFSRGATNL